MDIETINIFKKALMPVAPYKGGKGKSEVKNLVGDKKLYKLSSNENILGSSPKAIEAIQNHLQHLSEYPIRTDKKLRESLAEFYGGILEPDQFFADNSGVALLELIQRAFLDKGLEIIICNPSFKPYAMYARKLEAKVVDVPLIGESFDLDIEGILESINDRTRLIFLTSPNNPTGTYIPKEQIDTLIDALPEHVVLVYDEVYYQFVDADDYTIALPYVDAGKNVIAVNSFSKAYGLAGMRIGYAYSTKKIARYIAQLQIPFMINTLAQEAAKAALTDKEFIKQTVDLILTEKQFIYQGLEAIGVSYIPSQANFISIKPNMDIKEFEKMMIQEGVMVRPVANFGLPDHVRVTIGNRTANEAYLNALKKIYQR